MYAENSTSYNLSQDDVTWIVSSFGIAGMVGTLFTGPIIDFFGPRLLLLSLHLPSALFWLIKAFSPYKSLLYVARVGLVLILTVMGPLIPMLLSELSDPKIRGFMFALEEITVAFAILVMYILAQWVDWRVTTAACAAPSVLLFICNLFVPESPYWLARKGKLEAAEKSLQKLRVSKTAASQELQALTGLIKESRQTSFLEQTKQLSLPENYRPVLLLLIILILRELGGEYIIFSYSVAIFEEAQVNMDAFTCTVLVGVLRMTFTIISSLMLDRFGRRPLLLITTFLCAAASMLSGIFALTGTWGSSWIILISVLTYVASYGLGLGPIPWGLAGEMIPTPVRTVGGPICIFFYSLAVFGISHLFPMFIEAFGIAYVFFLFASSLVVLFVILWFVFPETKGKTLNELQGAFVKKTPETN
ncbi:hypothetical protein SK128_010324 [Halocaridina rubra]|uniref:Major facilitator superfamily (MFS) profile domain-containing protein n=1 Tax=Halocaridina rubra TaxID=373956 RepID=A0AAN8XAE3_HALRR